MPDSSIDEPSFRRILADQEISSIVVMALRELPSALRSLALRDTQSGTSILVRNCRRYASSEAAAPQEASEDFQDLDSGSAFISTGPADEKIKTYDPVKRAQGRRRELPPSRCVLKAIDQRLF
jgi:large subunit ribosomal protein L5